MDTYEKKYKNALTIARSRFKIEKDESVLTCLGMMFPELRESEDERIRKEIIDYLGLVGKGDGDYAQPMIDRWISYLEKQQEQKPAEWSEKDKNMWTHLNGYLNGFSCSEDAIKQMADWFYELPDRFNLQPKAEWSEEDEKMRTNAVLSLLYLIEECPNADFIDSVKKEKAWLESFSPQPQGVYKQIVHSIYKMLKGKDFYGMSTSNCISLLNDIRVKCKDADECAKILDEPSRKSIEELLDALDVTLGNFINKLNAL